MRWKIAVVVFDNGGHYIMKLGQDKLFNGRHIEVDLHNPDFVKLAEAFGGKGVRVASMDEFKPVLKEALDANVLTLIEYPILLDQPD